MASRLVELNDWGGVYGPRLGGTPNSAIEIGTITYEEWSSVDVR
jgi:hypothetical protein